MPKPPLIVAWISNFPLQLMPDLPAALRGLPRQSPATWAMVLLDEFRKRDDLQMHVIVLRSALPADTMFEWHGVKFHALRTSASTRVLSLFWRDTLLIRRCLRQIQPALVHAWGTELGAALVASRLGLPYVVTMQGLLGWYAQVVPDTNWFERFMAKLEPLSLRRAKVATTESSFAVRYLREHYPQLQVQQAEHAPNRVFREVQRRPELGPPKLLVVGSLGYRKGTDLLLQALGHLLGEQAFKLTLVTNGSATYLETLKPAVPPGLWQRVEIKQQLSPTEVAAELGSAALVVMPTRADTSPNAVKEAVVAGVPVVASAVGGIPDYVVHGENGFLVPADDLMALTQALREAMIHPVFSKGKVLPATLARMRDYLSPERMGQNFFAAYQLALQT